MDTLTHSGYAEAVALFQHMRRYALKSTDDPLWAYSYIRYSSDPQEEGDTLRRQSFLLDGWLKRNPGVRLDKTLKARDKKAVSGFTPDHRTNPKYVLAQLQSHVDSGRITPGSYLIVENLDRLTREHWADSVPYVLSLIAKGIRIVQLSPTEVMYDAEMDQGRLMMMLWELGRAHGESKLKSERIGAAWRAKKDAARQGVPFGKNCPAWMELVDGRYRLRPEASRVVRQIFKLSAEGYGSLKIKQRLVSSHEEPFAGPKWVRGYIAKILRDRSAIGEYQPKRWAGGKWTPEGEPIPNYYPAVVTEAEFYASQNAQNARSGRTGRPAKKGAATSPFAGLLYCANDGSKLYGQNDRGRRLLLSSAGISGDKGGRWLAFNMDHFVGGLLSQLREVAASELFNDPGAGQVAELQGRLSEVNALLGVAVKRFEANQASGVWADRIDAYEREKGKLEIELRKAAQAAANPVTATWAEAVELMRQREPARLRQCLLEVIESVWVLLVPRSREEKLAAVQIRFVGGGERFYLLLSRNPRGWQARQRPAECIPRSLTDKLAGYWDLREPKQAKRLYGLLEGIDLSTF